MRKTQIIGILLVVVLLVLGACAPKPAPVPPESTPVLPPTPAPASESYPMVEVSSYRVGSAERAFAEFLTAWKDEDWDRMAEFTQITWRSDENNAAETMRLMYGPVELDGAEIIEKEVLSDVMVDITAVIYYREIYKSNFYATLICETEPHHPDPEGKWGVNPTSTLRDWLK